MKTPNLFPLGRTIGICLLAQLCLAAIPFCLFAQDTEAVPPPEDIRLETKDGVAISATWYPGTKSKESVPVILCHAWGDDRRTMLGIASDRHFYADGCLFYDGELIDRCLAVPHVYRESNRLYAAVFRKLLPEMGAIPNSNTGLRADISPRRAVLGKFARGVKSKLFPDNVGNKATGNSPNEWARRIYPEFFRDPLADPRTQGRSFWDARGLERVWQDHLAGKINAGSPLGKVASVEFFCRKWLD